MIRGNGIPYLNELLEFPDRNRDCGFKSRKT